MSALALLGREEISRRRVKGGVQRETKKEVGQIILTVEKGCTIKKAFERRKDVPASVVI